MNEFAMAGRVIGKGFDGIGFAITTTQANQIDRIDVDTDEIHLNALPVGINLGTGFPDLEQRSIHLVIGVHGLRMLQDIDLEGGEPI
jgi:hypothetical protein